MVPIGDLLIWGQVPKNGDCPLKMGTFGRLIYNQPAWETSFGVESRSVHPPYSELWTVTATTFNCLQLNWNFLCWQLTATFAFSVRHSVDSVWVKTVLTGKDFEDWCWYFHFDVFLIITLRVKYYFKNFTHDVHSKHCEFVGLRQLIPHLKFCQKKNID